MFDFKKRSVRYTRLSVWLGTMLLIASVLGIVCSVTDYSSDLFGVGGLIAFIPSVTIMSAGLMTKTGAPGMPLSSIVINAMGGRC